MTPIWLAIGNPSEYHLSTACKLDLNLECICSGPFFSYEMRCHRDFSNVARRCGHPPRKQKTYGFLLPNYRLLLQTNKNPNHGSFGVEVQPKQKKIRFVAYVLWGQSYTLNPQDSGLDTMHAACQPLHQLQYLAVFGRALFFTLF